MNIEYIEFEMYIDYTTCQQKCKAFVFEYRLRYLFAFGKGYMI